MQIRYEKVSLSNFNEKSLDKFIRRQVVTECWRNIDGEYKLVPVEFIEDWDINKCRDIAKTIVSGIKDGCIAIGAFNNENIVGYIYLSNKLFGSKNQYLEVLLYHVSEPYRNNGIGKALFLHAVEESRKLPVTSLYISAHSSKESQYAYRKIGCIDAIEINKEIAENEPFDIQMEYQL
jgi:predicted GNAT superfamily acetyltransferase